jgi:uncharacterized lipoprotein YehR (DUF1307 family)
MKKILIILLAMLVLILVGCEALNNQVKSIESDVRGLDRVVTLYANDGSVIKRYEGKFTIKTEDGVLIFTHDGKRIILNGTYIVEEK